MCNQTSYKVPKKWLKSRIDAACRTLAVLRLRKDIGIVQLGMCSTGYGVVVARKLEDLPNNTGGVLGSRTLQYSHLIICSLMKRVSSSEMEQPRNRKLLITIIVAHKDLCGCLLLHTSCNRNA